MARTIQQGIAMEFNKLVFAGPVGAGKSTAILSVSSAPPVTTEQPLSDGPMGEKTTTTVALDYSYLDLDGDILHLYGLPGQEQLSFMREIILQGAYGVILLLDANHQNISSMAAHWLSTILTINPEIKIVIAVTKSEHCCDFSINTLRKTVKEYINSAPIITIDPREKTDVMQALRMLTAL